MSPLASSRSPNWGLLFLLTTGLVAALNFQSTNAQAPATSVSTQTTSRVAMERGNPQRTGVYSTDGAPPTGEASWETQKIFEMKRGKTQWGSSFYITDRSGTFHFSNPDILLPFAGVGYSDPVVANGVLYFSVYIGDGYAYAVDARTGELKWRAKREKGTYSPPVVAGDILYIGADSGLFFAIDLRTNQEKWRHTRPDQSIVGRPPLVADGFVYYTANNGYVYALDAQTGALKWNFETKGRYLSPTVVGDGMLYLAVEDILLALDSKSGEKKWVQQFKEGIGTPAVANGMVYFRDYQGHIRAVDAKTGEPQAKPHRDHQTGARIVIDGQTIYFTGRNAGKLFAVDALTRETKWEFSIAFDVRCTSPILTDDRVYFVCTDGRLYSVDAKTGKKAWSSHPRTFPLSPPVVANGMAYFISDDGKVYGLK